MVKIFVGGPWYRSTVDARLMLSILQILVQARAHEIELLVVGYEDGFLDASRNRLMTRALKSGADWFVSLDADCALLEENPQPLFKALRELRSLGELAILAAPVRQGNGAWNFDTNGNAQRSKRLPVGRIEVDRVGFGLVCFRLGWYAKHWDAHRWPYFQTVTLPNAAAPHGWGVVGEDFGHCNAVRTLGGKVVIDPAIRVNHHVARAGSFADRVDQFADTEE